MTKQLKYIIITFLLSCIIFIVGNFWYNDFQYRSLNEVLINFAFYQLYGFVLGYSNMFYFDYLKELDWREENYIKRIVIGVLGSVVITLVGLFVLRALTAVYYFNKTFETFLEKESISNYTFGLWVTLLIVAGFHIIYFYNKFQQNKLKEQKVIAGAASAKFNALKNQLDPHFLFNSLNVLTSLIEENPDKAQEFTTSLSKVYRYVLEQKNKDLVTLDEELQFAKTYMLLLKMRFEDSIVFQMPEKSTNPNNKVVPLSLQLLLENTVKHNKVTQDKPLKVTIYEKDDSLVIENNLQPKQIIKKGSGVGLANIKQRYQLLTNRKVVINQQADRFAVSIPMLTKQIVMMNVQPTNEQEAYYKAKKRVEEIKGFYSNLISYCIVIPFLIVINYKTHWEFQWFWFPAMGWGIGIVMHAFTTFGYGKDWEERKIQEILREQKQNNSKWQ